MAPNTLDFNTAVITGGAGGLGYAIAEYLISLGKKVIIAGRTESKLQEAAKKLGNSTSYYVLDTGDSSAIPAFAEKVIKEHPDVDCLINNAGVQRPLYFKDFDLEKADNEININIRGPMHLSVAFLPHFKSKPNGAVIMNVSSVLGFVPFSLINPVYNGTKAWLHFFTTNMRTQLEKDGQKIKVVEIVPPGVGTDLHREREDPDDNKNGANGAISVEEFMSDFKAGVEANLDTVSAGVGKGLVKEWDESFGAKYKARTSK